MTTRGRDSTPPDDGVGRARLADGRYDAFVVWAEPRGGAVAIELTITTGEHRGDVVELVAEHLGVPDPLELVALPCTLVVEGGVPRIEG